MPRDIGAAGFAEALTQRGLGDEQIDDFAELLLVAVRQGTTAPSSVAREHGAQRLHGGRFARRPTLHEHEGEALVVRRMHEREAGVDDRLAGRFVHDTGEEHVGMSRYFVRRIADEHERERARMGRLVTTEPLDQLERSLARVDATDAHEVRPFSDTRYRDR